MKAIDTRPGQGFKMDGKIFVVVGTEHRTPGNLRAFVQLKYRNAVTGQTLEKRFNPSDDIDLVDLDRRQMEYLFSDGSGATFMDTENYDQVVIPASVLGDALLYLRPNASAVVIFSENNPISLELPPAVELVVKDTSPGVKKATVTNVQKEAVMETGLKTRVPDFIEVGETVKISTEDGSYMSRA
ncbi:MAG TPA: elongation factor P [Phycisphaerales bacterium]|nr:elongation factor P [Phycisphaerales bacterium]